MESVLIIAPRRHDDTLHSRLLGLVDVSVTGRDPVVVTDGRTRVYLHQEEEAGEGFEPEHLERINALVGTPVFYSLDFSDVALCRRVLNALVNDPDLFVDNDHGVLCSGPEFLELIRQRPDWDWRLDRVKR